MCCQVTGCVVRVGWRYTTKITRAAMADLAHGKQICLDVSGRKPNWQSSRSELPKEDKL